MRYVVRVVARHCSQHGLTPEVWRGLPSKSRCGLTLQADSGLNCGARRWLQSSLSVPTF